MDFNLRQELNKVYSDDFEFGLKTGDINVNIYYFWSCSKVNVCRCNLSVKF